MLTNTSPANLTPDLRRLVTSIKDRGVTLPADIHYVLSTASDGTKTFDCLPCDATQDPQEQYALLVDWAQGLIDSLRTETPRYEGSWKPGGPLDSPHGIAGIASAWSVFYHCATAHAVGGERGEARLRDIGVPVASGACLAGVLEAHSRLLQLSPTRRAKAFVAMDFADHYFDPVES